MRMKLNYLLCWHPFSYFDWEIYWKETRWKPYLSVKRHIQNTWNPLRCSAAFLLFFLICSYNDAVTNLMTKVRDLGRVLAWGTMLQAGRPWVPFSKWPFEFFNWPNPSSSITILGSIQQLTDMSIKNLPGGKRRPTLMSDNLTAICELSV
jgi:hypothetical protein